MDLRFKMLLTSLVAGLVAIQMDSPRAFHKQCYPTGATLSPKVWAVTCCDFEPTSDTTLGRKLRTLEYFDGNREVDSSGTLWSRPPYPLRMFQAYKRENARPPTKMTSVVLNGPHTTGYSVCLDSRDMSLHVHKTDGPFSLCASPELRRPSGRWLYMPIAGDEWVSEVWLPSDSFQRSTLILITNTKRALVMGEHPRKGRGFSYKLITRLLNEPSLFYFDLSDGLREVALSVPLSQKAAIPELCLPKPASAYPQCLPTEDFFFPPHLWRRV